MEKGIRDTLPEGAVAHYPIVDVRAVLIDGSFHAVDSSEMAFKIAASTALKQGIQQAQPVLLEPVMALEVVTPDTYTGDVIGHLNGKRAHVQGMNTENEVTVVQAEAPMSGGSALRDRVALNDPGPGFVHDALFSLCRGADAPRPKDHRRGRDSLNRHARRHLGRTIVAHRNKTERVGQNAQPSQVC